MLASRRFGTNAAIAVGVLLLWAWGVWVSNYRRWFLVSGCIVAGTLAVTIEGLECSGDMGIIIRRRFGDKRADILAAHRQGQAHLDVATIIPSFADPTLDFPEYRGRRRDGVVAGPPLNRDWSAHPPRCLWRQPVGGGYAQFAISGNTAVTIEQRGGDEAVVCYDTETGRERWQHSYPARFTEVMGGEGPRATPTISEGKVYSLGATGALACLDQASGRPDWTVNILEGNENVRWGMSGSPLVFDNVVVVNPGAQNDGNKGKAVVALNRKTGQRIWASGEAPAGYSSPMLATLAGRRQIVLLDGDRIAGYDPEGAGVLWSYAWKTQYGINVSQPLILEGDRIFITAGYGMGGAMLQVLQSDGQWSIRELWKKPTMRCKFTSPVYYRGHIYGLDEGILACIDIETGQRKWRDGRYEHGQLVLTDDLLVILSETGKLALVEATPDGHHQLGTLPAVEGAKTWNPPALAAGKVFVRNAEEMACYDLAARGP